MADRVLTQYTEPSLTHGPVVPVSTVRIHRLSSGAPGIIVEIETVAGPETETVSVLIPDGKAFLMPVAGWLVGGTLPTMLPPVSGNIVGRAIEIGDELNKLDKAILEGRIAFTNGDMLRADYYETELFTVLSDHREKLRQELLALTTEKKTKE